jgi:FMN phosphatase YigB (HAD superfamily)
VPTYILSNTNELAIRFIRRTYPFFSGFTDYVFSFEHTSMKPDFRIYEILEATAGKRGSQLLYLDDRPENIAVGHSRGWRTILHSNPDESVWRVRAQFPPGQIESHNRGVKHRTSYVP